MDKKVGMLAATAAAGLFATTALASGNSAPAKKTEKANYFCQNNTCKGKSACGGHGNANGCAGANTCKGKGWLQAKDAKECGSKGGKWKLDETKKAKK